MEETGNLKNLNTVTDFIYLAILRHSLRSDLCNVENIYFGQSGWRQLTYFLFFICLSVKSVIVINFIRDCYFHATEPPQMSPIVGPFWSESYEPLDIQVLWLATTSLHRWQSISPFGRVYVQHRGHLWRFAGRIRITISSSKPTEGRIRKQGGQKKILS